MNAVVTSENILDADVNNYISNKEAHYDKHRKSSRYFPSMNEIAAGDRFSIPKGSSIFCRALQSTIVLHDDIKVEIAGVDVEDLEVDNSFTAVKLVKSGAGVWMEDQKFGTLEVEYTDLANWNKTSK